jgi:hypothetical protein
MFAQRRDARGVGSDRAVPGNMFDASTDRVSRRPGSTPRRALIIARPSRRRSQVHELHEQAGFRVQCTEDGLCGLMLAVRWQPDVIIVGPDIVGVTARTVNRMLRRHRSLVNVPVLPLAQSRQLRLSDSGSGTIRPLFPPQAATE